MADLSHKRRRPALPACITNALTDTRGDQIRRAAEALSAMLSEMHSVPCSVTIEEDFAFILVMRDLEGLE